MMFTAQYVVKITRTDSEGTETIHQQILDYPDDEDALLDIATALERSFVRDLERIHVTPTMRPSSNLRMSVELEADPRK